jgi:glycogen operon protein
VRVRQAANLLTTLLLSTGVPMLTAGDEMGRTQGGNNNPYCQDNEVSWVDWEPDGEWAELAPLVRRLLALRRDHPVFRQRHFFSGQPAVPGGRKDIAWFSPAGTEMSHAEWWYTQRRTLGMFLAGDAIRSRHRDGTRITDDSFLLWLHADPADADVRLPDGGVWAQEYEVLLDTARPGRVGERLQAGRTLGLGARSCVLLRAVPPPAAPRA